MGREGATKRRMLSLAERPSAEVEACWGVLPLTGAAEGIVGGGAGRATGGQLTKKEFYMHTGC
jgi:hypothetical protein